MLLPDSSYLQLFHKICNTSHSGIGGPSSSVERLEHSDHAHTLFGAESTPVDNKCTSVGVQPPILGTKMSNMFAVRPMPEKNKMAADNVIHKSGMNNFNQTSEVNTADMFRIVPPPGVNLIPPLLDYQSSTLHQQQKSTTALKPFKMDWNPGHPPQVISAPSHHPPQVISGPSHHPPQVISGPSHHPPQVISGPSHHPPQVISGPSHHPPQVISGPSHHPPQVISGSSRHHPPQIPLGKPSYIQEFDFPISTVAYSNMKAHHHRLAFSDNKAEGLILPPKHRSFSDEAGPMAIPDQLPFSDITGPFASHYQHVTIPLFSTEASRQSLNSSLSEPFSIGAHTMTRTPSRAPVKSLDLFDSPVNSHLWTHDRALALGNTQRPPPSAPTKHLPLPSTFGPTTGGWKLSAQDLKSFHFDQQQQQQPLTSVRTPPAWDLNDAPHGMAVRMGVRHNIGSKVCVEENITDCSIKENFKNNLHLSPPPFPTPSFLFSKVVTN